MIVALLAPGPSATREQAEAVWPLPLGVVGCAFQLAPWADFIASSDAKWWRTYPEAMQLPERYCMANHVRGVERVRIGIATCCNSGVLALEVAKRKGATRILLLGFDMHGSHFFGKYTNGLTNTIPAKRKQHLAQYAQWRRMNPGVEVINCTPDSALQCFPKARLEDVVCRHVQVGDAWVSGDVHCETRQHPAADGGEALREAS